MELEQKNSEIEIVSDECFDSGRQLELKQSATDAVGADFIPVDGGSPSEKVPKDGQRLSKPWKIRKPPRAAERSLPCVLPDQTSAYAGFWRRAAAHVIDWFIVALLGFFLSSIVLGILQVSSSNYASLDVFMMLCWYVFFFYAICTTMPVTSGFMGPMMILQMAKHSQPIHQMQAQLFIFIFMLVFGPWIVDGLYRSSMESSSQQATFGKMLLKIYVIDKDGKRLTFRRALVRHFSKLFSGLPPLFGYFLAATGKQKDALHDKFAGTHVIKAGLAPPAVPKIGPTEQVGK